MNWFRNDGGPLAVMPRSPQPLWEGTDPPSRGREVAATFRFDGPTATDYDRACDVAEPAEFIAAGPGWILVLGGVVQEAAWLPLKADDVVVVSEDWLPDKSEQSVRALLGGMGNEAWTLVKHDVPVERGGLVLTHAGSTLDTIEVHSFDSATERGYAVIGDGISYPAPPGLYRIEVLEIFAPDDPDADLRGSFVRFRRTHTS